MLGRLAIDARLHACASAPAEPFGAAAAIRYTVPAFAFLPFVIA